jgi:hypothetical protein
MKNITILFTVHAMRWKENNNKNFVCVGSTEYSRNIRKGKVSGPNIL